MRIVAATARGIGELQNKVVCFSAFGGFDHIFIIRIGAAVNDVFTHRTVQQRGVLRHHANLGTQAVLCDVGNILSIDQDAAFANIVETQQQIDDGGFPRTGSPYQTDFFAGTDGEIELVDNIFVGGFLRAVCEAHIVETNLATRNHQRFGVGSVHDGVRPGKYRHAVAHGADVFEQGREFPHDPVRNTIQP